jgi:hypothetical protein
VEEKKGERLFSGSDYTLESDTHIHRKLRKNLKDLFLTSKLVPCPN